MYVNVKPESCKIVSDTKNHGRSGPLPVRDSIFVSPLAKMYEKMARKTGFQIQDVNGDNQTAFDIPQVQLTFKLLNVLNQGFQIQ